MDQGPLVAEQIDAGALLARDFDRYKPVRAAFWLKQNEDSFWYLYIASDQIDGSNVDLAYGEVIRLVGEMNNPNFDPFRVKVIRADDPIAQSVLEIQAAYPAAKVAIRRNHVWVGRMLADELYIYPLPNLVPGV